MFEVIKCVIKTYGEGLIYRMSIPFFFFFFFKIGINIYSYYTHNIILPYCKCNAKIIKQSLVYSFMDFFFSFEIFINKSADFRTIFLCKFRN